MKSKIFARVLCIILCAAIIGSVLLIAIPLFSANAAETIVSGGSGYVTEDYVNLRSAASQSSSIVAVLRKNTRIVFEEGALFNGNWLKIRELSGNRSGYVMRDYVSAGEAPTIRLDSMTASTYVGCQYAFSQTGASNPVWSTSDSSVAVIDQNGVMTAKKAGTVSVKASQDGSSGSCIVKISEGVSTGITPAALTLSVGGTGRLTANGQVYWYSSDSTIATVTGGFVRALHPGYATISAFNANGASTCLVHVTASPQPVHSLKLSAEKASTYTGCRYALGLTGGANPVWSSSDTSVLTVDGNGVVTAKKAGTATVTVSDNGATAQCRFTVSDGAATGISPQDMNLLTGTTGKLIAKTTGVSWYSSNKAVATVSDGTVRALAAGYTTISAYTINGASTCLVHVTDSALTSDIQLCSRQVTTYTGCQYAFWATGADTVSWSTSDTSVAMIGDSGVMMARGAGSCTLTARSGSQISTAKITVLNGTSTNISSSGITLALGQSATLTAAAGVSWFSSNPQVATVSGGTVTAKGEGYTTVSAYNANGASTCLVHVTAASPTPTPAPGGTIRFGVSAVTTYTGVRYALPVTGASGASWSSSDTGVATVDQNGVVTAKAAGTTVIRAANSVSSASCTVTIRSGYGPGISLTEDTIAAGKSLLLSSDNYNADWSSSNNDVAEVKNGVVTAKASGYATIIASTANGASACLLHVTEPDSIRFVYTSPNSAPLNATVSFKAITDKTRTAVQFVVSNGTTSYTVNATSKVSDGDNYIWTGSRTLSTAGLWNVQAYARTASTGYATTPENGEGEVLVSSASDYSATVTGERRASNEVLDMIASFEGFLPDLTGNYITGDPSIGHGKVIWENEQFYNHLTRAEAFAYLCQTTNEGPYTSVTNDFLLSHNAKCNQYQFDALVCFAYNLGPYALVNDELFSSAMFGSSSGGTVRAGGSGYVNASDVNLRSGAGSSYAIVTNMEYNTGFTFVDATLHNGSWYRIRLANGTTGYVYHTYVTPFGSACDLADTNKSAFTQRMLQYHHAAGSCYYGLLWRRVDEVETYFYGDYTVDGERNKYGMYFRCAKNSGFGIG